MDPNLSLTFDNKTLRGLPLARRALTLNSTLFEILITARELSWDVDDKKIEEWVQNTSISVPEPALRIRKLYAEHRAFWQELLAKVGIPKLSPDSVESTDTPLVVTDNQIHKHLSDEDFEIFKENSEMVDLSIQRLLRAVHLNVRFDDIQSEAADDFESKLDTAVGKFKQTQHQSTSAEVLGKDALGVLVLIRENITALKLKIPHECKTVLSWNLDEDETFAREKNTSAALRVMRRMTRDIKAPSLPLPDFGKWTVVVHWELTSTTQTPDPKDFPRNSFVDSMLNHNNTASIAEKNLGVYPQSRVNNEDFRPNGKYRGVCKIMMKYHDDWHSGTGWLIDEQTVITAAHNLYDKKLLKSKPGIVTEHAVQVLVAIGYSGNQTVAEDEVEIRYGSRVAIHSGYYEMDPHSHLEWWAKYDIAAIKLTQPFKVAKGFQWMPTPATAWVIIEVVGYPGDLPTNAPENEKGSIMFKSRQLNSFDLKKDGGQLSYKLDTTAGNSGGPVLHLKPDGDIEVIGIHTGWEPKANLNQATLLGCHGNNPNRFCDAFDAIQNGKAGVSIQPITLIDGVLSGHRIHIATQ